MSKWLEDEEQKKSLKDQEISLWVQREEAVHTHLRQFYDLCHRVNGVRYDSLSIDRLKVECKLSHQIKTDGYQSFHTVDERRGIRISCPNQDETFIDVVIKKHSRDVYWNDDTPPADYSSDEERVVIRNTCTLQELIDWREDQIIHFIQWMLLESEVIKGSIPGKEIKNELAEAEAQKAKAEAEQIRTAWERVAATERAALAAASAAAEAPRLRRNAASGEAAMNCAAFGAVLGGIVMGFSGCVSCLNNFQAQHTLITDFNLFNGLLFGAIGGAVIGVVVGIAIGQMKD
ncbi:MAG: hypothetical protein AABO57_28555 [Acidobacteriota bacterium]